MSKKKCSCEHSLTHDEKQSLENLEAFLKDYEIKPGSLIPVLQIAQKMIGYLPKEALRLISRKLREPLAKVYGVATFYSLFTLFRAVNMLYAFALVPPATSGAARPRSRLSRKSWA